MNGSLNKGILICNFFFSVLDDECRDMMCGGSCQYNYGNNEFACTCPENTYLNDDGSSCVQFDDSEGKFFFFIFCQILAIYDEFSTRQTSLTN